MSRTGPARALPALWWLLAVTALGVLAVDRWGDLVRIDGLLPGWSVTAAVSALMGSFTWALAERIGIMPLVSGLLAAAGTAGSLLLGGPEVQAGVAVLLCVVTAVLAVMLTVPAPGFAQAAREVLIATLIAAAGGLGVAGVGADVSAARFEYAALILALVWSLIVVSALGAGLHGLGRRGLITVVAAAVLILLAVGYGELFQRYGSPGLVRTLEDLRRQIADLLLVVPHPLATLLGVPALAWGTFTRARRRQGWWVTAFGVAATSSTATLLIGTGPPELEALATLYSIVLGLVLGYAVIRIDQFFTGPRGSRARRVEEASALRPEPRRGQSLR